MSSNNVLYALAAGVALGAAGATGVVNLTEKVGAQITQNEIVNSVLDGQQRVLAETLIADLSDIAASKLSLEKIDYCSSKAKLLIVLEPTEKGCSYNSSLELKIDGLWYPNTGD